MDVWKIHEETEDDELMEACEKHVPLVLKEMMFRVKNAVKNGACCENDSNHFPDVAKKILIRPYKVVFCFWKLTFQKSGGMTRYSVCFFFPFFAGEGL